MEQAIATIVSGIFSEYGALVGGMMCIIIFQNKKIDKLETKNDALEKEIRDTLSGVVTQNTLTFGRLETSWTQFSENLFTVLKIRRGKGGPE